MQQKKRFRITGRFLWVVSIALLLLAGYIFRGSIARAFRDGVNHRHTAVLPVGAGVTGEKSMSADGHWDYEPLSKKEIDGAVANGENGLNNKRKAFVQNALSLHGKVSYFWGGKSLSAGWDEQWGKPRMVDAEGSVNTGKEIAYGLDCSGFVAWCYRQSGFTEK